MGPCRASLQLDIQRRCQLRCGEKADLDIARRFSDRVQSLDFDFSATMLAACRTILVLADPSVLMSGELDTEVQSLVVAVKTDGHLCYDLIVALQ